jgi:hypothetical protein
MHKALSRLARIRFFYSLVMHKIRVLTLLLIATTSLARAAEFLHYEKAIHPSVGALRFELVGVPATPKEQCCSGEDVKATLVVTDKSGKVIQKIPQDYFPVDRGRFDFLDVNGDGHFDLLIYNQRGGVGPLMHADVWMYVPRLGLFVISKTLSGRGEVSKSKRTNCVLVEYKSGPMGYTTEEWCFNQAKGLWKLVGVSGGEPDDE